jgi:dipeptidyl aminopeptidase/acylaminoacyl peptidase
MVGESKETATNTAIATPIQITSTPFQTATITITPFPSPSSSPSSLPGAYWVQKECFAMQPNFPPDANPQGILILESQLQHEFLDLETGRITEVARQMGYTELQVSPDRKKVAYHDIKNNQIVVTTEDNQLLRSIPWEKNWITLVQWQNDENLLIRTKELLKSDFPDPPNVLVVVNTITGQSQNLIPDYPEIVQAYTLQWGSGHTVYDPTLTHVAYAQKTKTSENYTLWDIPGKRELISLPADIREEPVWSPDGSTFIVFTHKGLTLVSRDGTILYAIDINRMLVSGTNNPHYSARDFRYSPDGNRIAFWLINSAYQENAETYHLVILDTRNGKVVDTCLEQGDDLVGFGWVQPSLVWSPRGHQIAVYANYRESENTWDVLVANIDQKSAVKIAENLYPVGWMVKTP